MSGDDEFFDAMKGEIDPKEWADRAEYFINIRKRPESTEPPPEPEKTAGAGDVIRQVGRAAFNTAKRVDPTKLIEGLSKSKGHLAAGLAGAGLVGAGTILLNRGKPELGGKSQLEHDLSKKVEEQNKLPEGTTFTQKATRHLTGFGSGLARIARQHPIQAGLLAAIPGAKAGLKVMNALQGKGK